MMTLVKFRYLSLIFLLILLGCSTKYKVQGIDGQSVIAKGRIEKKIFFKTSKGIPVLFEADAIDSLYINANNTVVMNNTIFYEAKIKTKDSETISGFITANNRFIGENGKLSFDVPFNKIQTIEKVK